MRPNHLLMKHPSYERDLPKNNVTTAKKIIFVFIVDKTDIQLVVVHSPTKSLVTNPGYNKCFLLKKTTIRRTDMRSCLFPLLLYKGII